MNDKEETWSRIQTKISMHDKSDNMVHKSYLHTLYTCIINLIGKPPQKCETQEEVW